MIEKWKKENIIEVQSLDIEIWNTKKKIWIESNELMIKINGAAEFMFQLKILQIKEFFNRNDAATLCNPMVIFTLIFYCCLVKSLMLYFLSFKVLQ